MKKCLIAVSLLSVLSLPSVADGFYVVGDVGSAKWQAEDGSETKTTYMIGGGYRINEIFSAEVAYRDLGKISDSDEYSSESVGFNAIQASVLAAHAFSDAFSLYGRIGMAKVSLDVTSTDFDSISLSKNKCFIGFGGRFALNENLGIRLEYNQYDKFEELELSASTIGIDYHF